MATRFVDRLQLPKIEWNGWGTTEERPSAALTTVYMILTPVAILMVIGLLMAFSSQAVTNISKNISPYTAFGKPLFLLAAALIAGAVASAIGPDTYRRWATPLWVLTVLIQLLVLTPLGASEGGNTNWIRIPGIPFLVQPSELLKLTSVMVLAQWLARPGTRLHDWKQVLLQVGLVLGVTTGAIMVGHDMGTTMVMLCACLAALVVAGLPWKWFGISIAAAIPVIVFEVFSNATRVDRIKAILPGFKPERDLSAPEQIDHSLWAFGSGGVFGLGPGASREKWDYLQAAHTDFILAIVGEEFGLVGSLVVVGCLITLVLGMIRLAASVDSFFESMLVAGIAGWIGIQSIINVATVTDLGPVIGVPLPFVSTGGSSLIFTTAAMGVVVSIARHHAGVTRKQRSESGTFGRDPRLSPRRRARS